MTTLKQITVIVALGATSAAQAAVSADEAAQLGKTLTPMGAVKAGNADGSIPAYTGGLDKPPAGYKPGQPTLPDPFAAEKPLFKIDASNMDKYADKLSEGVKHLLKTKPGFYLNVYPSHRTAKYPKAVEDATVRNATKADCKLEDGGNALSKGCRGGVPFPLPKNGYEVMWNKLVNYSPVMRVDSRNWLLDSSGNALLTSALRIYFDRLGYYGTPEERKNTDAYVTSLAVVTGPVRSAGAGQGFNDHLNPLQKPRIAFSYTPGQRRVRTAPEFDYDTPHGQFGGAIVYDEIFLFSGAMDRFDFKLLGKKEMYIPYNNYKTAFGGCQDEKVLFKGTAVNPECERWELHRTWVVEATLKPGARHIYKKRVWYVDEDNFVAGGYDAYDQANKLYRTGYSYSMQVYEPGSEGPYFQSFVLYDTQKNLVAFQTQFAGVKWGNPLRESEAQPEAYLNANTTR